MSCRKTIAVRFAILSFILGTIVLLGQSTLKAPNSTPALEFPVFMQQNIVAGKTPVGTKIKARLAVATLVHGVVIPTDAILLGEVIESAAKSATAPSRLAIRVDSAQWKKRSMPIVLALSPEAYLTAWYYPEETPALQDFPQDLPPRAHPSDSGPIPVDSSDIPSRHGNNSPRDADRTTEPATPPPSARVSRHRELMKNIESSRGTDRSITLISKRSNVKLDKSTTYVLAAGDLLPSSQ
jgi:hypothetical protein